MRSTTPQLAWFGFPRLAQFPLIMTSLQRPVDQQAGDIYQWKEKEGKKKKKKGNAFVFSVVLEFLASSTGEDVLDN